MNFQTAHLIACVQDCFRHDERLIYFFFHHLKPELRLPTDHLLDEARSLSGGEYILVQAALDFWNGEGGLKLIDAVNVLDDENLLALLRAILRAREIEFTDVIPC